jgi:hypothetical protein
VTRTLKDWLADAKRHRADAHEAARAAQKDGDTAGHAKFARIETALADLISATK